MNRPAWREPSPFIPPEPPSLWERIEPAVSTVCFILFLGFCVYVVPAFLAGMHIKVCPTVDHHVRCDL